MKEKEQAQDDILKEKEMDLAIGDKAASGSNGKKNTVQRTTSQKGQTSLKAYGLVNKLGKKSTQQLLVDAELTLLLIGTGQSFNVTSNEALSRWMNFCYPEANVKSPNTFAQ